MNPTQLRSRRSDIDLPGVFLMTNSFETGGSERQFSTIAQALATRRFRVELGCLSQRGAFSADFGEVTQFNVGGSFLSLRAQLSRVALGRRLRSQRIAVAHSFDFYTNLMLIPTAWLARVPVVIGSQRQIGDLLSGRQFAVQAAVFRLCDAVVCNSCAAADRLRESGLPERKLRIIPNALADAAFAETAPALERQPGLLRVGMIARMNKPVKNHPGFLRAAARVVSKFPNVEFVLVGDGPLRPEFERLAASLGLGDRVRFLGDRRDIPAVLASLDLTVLPSFSESLPNAVLESMAAGVPVVATRVGGNPEAVVDGQTGLLVAPRDDDELATAIERLLSDTTFRAECGLRAKEIARSTYSLDRVTAQYERLYQELLDPKRREPARHDFRPPAPRSDAASGGVRVAIVAASPRWIGGHGVQADLLMRHWQNDSGVQARFVPIDPEFPRRFRWAERIPLLRTFLRTPLYLGSLWRAFRDVQIVHIFSASYWSFLVAPVPAWLVARLRGKAVLINYHSGEARDHLQHWRTAVPVLKRADRLVVPSNFLVDVFREFKLHADVVPNLVDLSQFRYRPRQPLAPRLICTRGFHPYYSVDVVVRAFAEVKRVFPEARLCLVGKGPLEQAIRTLVDELNLADLEFTGPVPHREIHTYYDRADIFINASWLDNMPISILEAFASGTPVATTAPEGIRYLVEHERTGLLSEPGDAHALAQNVLRLLQEPGLGPRLASHAYEQTREYAWEAVRAAWLAVYQSMRAGAAPTASELAARSRRNADERIEVGSSRR